jgi:hypothetical protein
MLASNPNKVIIKNKPNQKGKHAKQPIPAELQQHTS